VVGSLAARHAGWPAGSAAARAGRDLRCGRRSPLVGRAAPCPHCCVASIS